MEDEIEQLLKNECRKLFVFVSFRSRRITDIDEWTDLLKCIDYMEMLYTRYLLKINSDNTPLSMRNTYYKHNCIVTIPNDPLYNY